MREAQYAAAGKQSKAGLAGSELNSGELYRIPVYPGSIQRMAPECITWPRYDAGAYSLSNVHGESMLELTLKEQQSLQIVCLRCSVEKQLQTGSSFNWKKVALSRAYYRHNRLNAKDMTPKVAAAFKFLLENNVYYKYFLDKHNAFLEAKSILTLSTFSLFITENGIECAIRPYLYPTTDFTDTGILGNYRTASADYTQRVVSTGLSWTRNVLSSVRAYGEDRDLTFFMYE